MSAPAISVIMPAYNAERYVGAAVESILTQTLGDFELLVFDDGSTDRTRSILEGFAARDLRVRVLPRAHQGYVALLNEGLQLARADLVARMDADDISLPERFARQLAFLRAHPEVAAVGAQAQIINAAGLTHRLITPPENPTVSREVLQRQSAFVHPLVMMRRQQVLAVGSYRPALIPAEDFDLWLRLGAKHTLANLPEVLLHYRMYDAQTSMQRIAEQVVRMLAARRAFAARGRGEPDPLDGRSRIDQQTLIELGMTTHEVSACILQEYLARADSLEQLGNLSDVARVLDGLATTDLVPALRGRARAEINWRRGKLALAQRRWLPSAALLARACLRRPRFLPNLFAALTRRQRRAEGT